MADEQTEKLDPTSSPPDDGVRRKVIKKRVPRKQRQEELEQPDEFMEVGFTLVDWLMDNLRIVGPVLGIFFVALFAGALMQTMDRGDRLEAAAALYEATELLPEADNPFAGGGLNLSSLDLGTTDNSAKRREEILAAVAELAAVGEEYSGTPQGGMAHIQAGHALSRIASYEEALVHFEAAANQEGTVGRIARGGQAYTLASLGRFDEALAVFDPLIAQSTGAMKEQLLVDQAKVYEAKGDLDKAEELYASFEAEFPDSSLVSEAQQRSESISAKKAQ